MFYVENENLRVSDEFCPTEENALDLSIQKWEFILNYLETESVIIYGGNSTTCALCIMHSRCLGCPVKNAGHYGCSNTPWASYSHAWDVEEAKVYAQQEIDFLKGKIR